MVKLIPQPGSRSEERYDQLFPHADNNDYTWKLLYTMKDLEGEIALFQMFLVLAMICPYSFMCFYASLIESMPSIVFSHLKQSWPSQKGI